MDDKRIFELAEKHGWLDDFGRWNFKDDGLISFACSIERGSGEPLVWMNKYGHVSSEKTDEYKCPLYAEPQSKPWVGLTDEDIQGCESWCGDQHDFAYEIEAKLKEKNSWNLKD
jgi:hypothetical protein